MFIVDVVLTYKLKPFIKHSQNASKLCNSNCYDFAYPVFVDTLFFPHIVLIVLRLNIVGIKHLSLSFRKLFDNAIMLKAWITCFIQLWFTCRNKIVDFTFTYNLFYNSYPISKACSSNCYDSSHPLVLADALAFSVHYSNCIPIENMKNITTEVFDNADWLRFNYLSDYYYCHYYFDFLRDGTWIS